MTAHRVALGLMAAALAAGADNSVAGLIASVRNGIASHQQDAKLAGAVAKIKLDERLDRRAVEELESEGAGPATTAELERLREASESKPEPRTPLPFANPPAPTAAEIKATLAGARAYSESYARSLPDFVCQEVVHRLEGGSLHGPWTPKDKLTVQVRYAKGSEDYKLILVNDRAAGGELWSQDGAVSEGEFGSLMAATLSEDADAELAWDHWTRLRGRRVQVYRFHIPPGRSIYQLEFGLTESGGRNRRASAVAGQRGLLYIDPETHAVMRLMREAVDLPEKFPVATAGTTLDYDYAEIGGERYLLPLRATVRMSVEKFHTRNEIEFLDYRKFSSDAVITFGDPAAPVKHLP